MNVWRDVFCCSITLCLNVWPTAVVSNRRMEKTRVSSVYIALLVSWAARTQRSALALAGPACGQKLRKLSLIWGHNPGPGWSRRWEPTFGFIEMIGEIIIVLFILDDVSRWQWKSFRINPLINPNWPYKVVKREGECQKRSRKHLDLIWFASLVR